jgi:hypothetical protein
MLPLRPRIKLQQTHRGHETIADQRIVDRAITNPVIVDRASVVLVDPGIAGRAIARDLDPEANGTDLAVDRPA